MRRARLWKRLLGVEHAVVEDVELATGADGLQVLVVSVRPDARRRKRCSRCGRRCRGYDAGEGRRRWRGLDLGATRVYLAADAPRVCCPTHGVVVAAVPWARAGARFTRAFEETVAWLTAHAAASTVAELMRVSWRSVTGIVSRVVAEARAGVDRLAGLRRVGIDEIAYRKGHRYLLAVVDHGTGRLVWAAEGRDQATVGRFFDALGDERAAQLTHVSADGAEWIHAVIAERAPRASICLDPFHVIQWVTDAIDAVRRRMVRDLRGAGRAEDAAALKGTRWAVLKNPETLTAGQRTTVASLAKTNNQLYRAYLIKEQAREVFAVKGARGRALLAGLISWAARSRIPEMVALARTLRRYRPLILNTLDHGVTNARSEATNTHLRMLTRRAYGYHSADALIAMAELTRGGLCPPLPGRAA